MRNRLGIAALALVSLVSGPCEAQTLLVRNVRGYTPVKNTIEQFSALLIVDGRVRQLSHGEELNVAADVAVIEGGGKTLLPGLIDAHGHVLRLGEEQQQVDLRGSPSLRAALRRITAFAKDNASDPWVLGRGWNQVLWAGGAFPTAQDLDTATGGRPAMLSRVDDHAVWVNSQALRNAGITRDSPDPAGGQILRDAEGNPTGILIDNAMRLIERHLPKSDDAAVKRALRSALRELVKVGLTGVHDAGIDARQYRLYQQLGAAGELPLRIYAMLADSSDARRIMVSAPKAPQFDDRLQMRAVKALLDGALGSRGAALLADYTDQSGHRGSMLYTPQQLQELARLTATHGWQLNLHAIGDAGNRLALDTFANVQTAAQRQALRPRIEHAQVVAIGDLPRFAALGVIASVQPTHATSDMNMAEQRIGAERIKGAYAWRKLLDSGARLAGGSDFPVELPNPFHGLYAAVTRQDHDGNPHGGWYGNEKLTRAEALRLFTIDAAYAGRMERSVGSLEPGKWADFVLIDRDYFAIPDNEIDDIRVLTTYLAGRKVSESDAATLRSGEAVLVSLASMAVR